MQPEPDASATGDIPDNQVFLILANRGAGYSVKYPEGWVQRGSGEVVVFADKNNIVRIVVRHGTRLTPAAVRKQLAGLPGVRLRSAPEVVTLPSGTAVKAVYAVVSAPNPVTGKRVTLTVDRYYLFRGGRRAVVDLGTPVGVDNVDAYRLMIESFRWR